MKKYLVPTLGAVAFVIGGLIARQKTLEGIETLEKTFNKKTEEEPATVYDISSLDTEK